MAKTKKKDGRLSVFKGREARLNRAIFHALAEKGTQAIYDIAKQVRRQRGLRHTKYTNVSRRVKALEQQGYLDKAGKRSTQPGSEATLYQLSTRAHVALLLNQVSPDTLIEKADEETLTTELAALILFFEKAPDNAKRKPSNSQRRLD